MSFGVRGTVGGESVCKGTGQTHFVREPVFCPERSDGAPTAELARRWPLSVDKISSPHELSIAMRGNAKA